MNEQPITSSVYTFENLRQGGFLYVDKTKYLYKLVKESQSMFFFSRPRRFGKSLTLSTLKAIFQGKKELFNGLYIENQPYDWNEYPVIHIDMGSVYSDEPDELKRALFNLVKEIARNNHIELENDIFNEAFKELILRLNEKSGKVVILIDEYDKPILNNIENENIEKLQAVMKGFYSVLKTCEPYERFVFITGVGKFLKVSVFSDLNNLTDISMSDDYAEMCGYTEKELLDYFQTRLRELAKQNNKDYKSFIQGVKEWYDGYKFSKRGENVYNPVSFAKFLENHGDFNNYWFETGSPSILIKLIKTKDVNIEEVLKNTYSEDNFTAYMPSKIAFIPLMYQTGYLPIKSWSVTNRITEYKLGFPNFEVEESFYRRLIANVDDIHDLCGTLPTNLRRAFRNNDIAEAMKLLKAFFSGIPYDIQVVSERYYQSIFYSIFKSVGFAVEAEARTSNGRIDAVVETDKNVYIFEFKLDKSAEFALDQIINKEYYEPYLHSGKKIMLIGANFNSETRKMGDWVTKEIED